MIITGRAPGEQTCWSEPWTGFPARTGWLGVNCGLAGGWRPGRRAWSVAATPEDSGAVTVGYAGRILAAQRPATGQRWCACCKTGPSLRRLIMKPRKMVVKSALRASLGDQPFGLPMDHESCRGFIGAYRRDGRVRVLADELRSNDPAGYPRAGE
jgi:hypothetical protein